MKPEITEVKTEEQREIVAALADEIWHEHYRSIISIGQIDYMIEKYQTAKAIQSQLEEGYRYFLVHNGKEFVGYTSIKNDLATGKMFLSKVYVRKKDRGKGFGRCLFELVEEKAREAKSHTVWLTVNRNNTESVGIYKKRGFSIEREEDNEIGEGYVMNDFIMEKSFMPNV